MNKQYCYCVVQILFIIIEIIIPDISCDNQYRQDDSNGNNVGLDYIDYPQADQESLQDQAAKYQQSQIFAESRRRKGELGTIKDQTDRLNDSFTFEPNWPDLPKPLGPVSAVTIDPSGNIVIFTRVDRIWNAMTFDFENRYNMDERAKGPIADNTVIAYNHKTGKIIYEWGKNLFFMPHGLTIDKDYNVWITDVALHQVMKFTSTNNQIDNNPLLVLGTMFKPGNGPNTFCKPTSVAVLPTGEFFVADGYCNARIIKFNSKGERILMWGENSFQGKPIQIAPKNFFAIPHGLTLAQDKDLLCVADRENGRVQCFHTINGTFHSQYHSPIIGDRLFSVSYAPVNGGQLYVINGPVISTYHEVKGFVIDMTTGNVISKFAPNGTDFSSPHDIAVTPDGKEVYVASISPNRIFKFQLTSSINETVEVKQPIVTSTTIPKMLTEPIVLNTSSEGSQTQETGSTALIIVLVFAITGILAFGFMVLISRRRKRGCMPFGIRNRRHAWDFPTVKPEGFKLGNLLDRKRGFEKLNQDASDEEPNVTTNMLSSPQFA